MSTPHTPGPWHVYQGNAVTTSANPQPGALFVCHAASGGYRTKEEQVANLQLISAAPDLLDALITVMTEADFGDESLAEKCRSAIAKATTNPATVPQ